MKQPNNIAVIGHLVWDRLNYADGRSIEAFGGITYNLAAMASVAAYDTKIYPVCYLGKDFVEKTREYWGRFPQIDWSLVRILKQNQEIHILKYNKTGYRREDNLNLFPQISKANFKNCPNIDIALVNYIGGDEFPPTMIRWLKARYDPKIYLDFHSLALSRVSKSTRNFRRHPHWRKYISEANIVQMNAYELATLYPETENEPARIFEAAIQILEMGPRAILVTRENQDLIAVWKDGQKIIKRAYTIPKVPRVVDSTGCGDTFSAGFVYALGRGLGFEACCLSGLRLAAKKITFSGPDGFFKKI
jgi:hypothetical protein